MGALEESSNHVLSKCQLSSPAPETYRRQFDPLSYTLWETKAIPKIFANSQGLLILTATFGSRLLLPWEPLCPMPHRWIGKSALCLISTKNSHTHKAFLGIAHSNPGAQGKRGRFSQRRLGNIEMLILSLVLRAASGHYHYHQGFPLTFIGCCPQLPTSRSSSSFSLTSV